MDHVQNEETKSTSPRTVVHDPASVRLGKNTCSFEDLHLGCKRVRAAHDGRRSSPINVDEAASDATLRRQAGASSPPWKGGVSAGPVRTGIRTGLPASVVPTAPGMGSLIEDVPNGDSENS